jgi:uncharacterized protein
MPSNAEMNPISQAATAFRIHESNRVAENAVFDHRLPAGEPFLLQIKRGQTLRIVDLEGNQAADVLFYNADDHAEHYSATDTMLRQGGIYLTTGSVLYSSEARPMLTIVADTCGRHDTLGGACAAESNTVRYALQKKYMHSCRDNYLNVPVTAEGDLKFEDGVSGPGKYVEMRADLNLWMLISNCPQLNNPCNAYNPTPIRLIVWDAV